MQILNIDPNASSSAAIALILQSEGHSVSNAGALNEIDDFSGYHMVLMSPDFLPDVRGLEALRLLRKRTNVPIITLFEGPPSLDDKVGALGGGDQFLERPVGRRKLLDTIDRLADLDGRCSTHSGKSPPPGPGSLATGKCPRTGGFGHVHAVLEASRA